MAASKNTLLMMMIVCFVSGGLAFLLAAAGGPSFALFSAPGFVIGGFFAYKYATYDRKKAREAEHKRRRDNSNRH